MTPYIAAFLAIPLGSVLSRYFPEGRTRAIFCVFAACIGLFLLQALRLPSVGIDVASYLAAYAASRELNFLEGDRLYNFELGYSLYSQFLAQRGLNEQTFLTLTAAIILIPVALTIARYSKMPALSVFLYATLGFYAFSFSGLRQAMAVAFCFWAFRYIQSRRLVRFCVIVAVAALFHQSALAFLPAYWIYAVPATGLLLVAGIGGGILTFLLRNEIFDFLSVLYKGEPATIESTGAATFFVILMFAWVAIFILIPGAGSQADGTLLRGTHNFLYVAVLFQALAGASSVVGRTGFYYLIFAILLVPEVLNSPQIRGARYPATALIVPLCLLFFNLQATAFDLIPYRAR